MSTSEERMPKEPVVKQKVRPGRTLLARFCKVGAWCLLPLLCIPLRVAAQPPGEVPAEERRLSAEEFREGLKARGLTELLELYLREFPPANVASMLLIQRELKLAEAIDPTLTRGERREALTEANVLLETLIGQAADDPRLLEWQLDLARSRLYDEGEPYFTSILYRGGSAEDRRRLQQLTQSVVALLTKMRARLEAEFERIDNLPVRDFERLERSGYVEALDRWEPQVEYLYLWASFYDALPRPDGDPLKTRRLHEVLDGLEAQRHLWETPQDYNPAQVPTLLLAGMAQRLLNDHASARTRFEQVLQAARRVEGTDAAADISWALNLAWLERVRNERDAGDFKRALTLLEQFKVQVVPKAAEEEALNLVAALLERSVYRAWARRAKERGDTGDAQRYRRLSWEPLARLVRRHSAQRDEAYATLRDLLEPGAPLEQLDPLEQCALLAGLLHDAARAEGGSAQAGAEKTRILDQALQLGQHFIGAVPPGAEALLPEVMFNLGVAQYERGRGEQAAAHFIQVARDYPDFIQAQQAVVLAVEVTAERYHAPSATRDEVLQQHLAALEILMLKYADSAAARYWRFYYGQALEEAGRCEVAAYQYALVEPDHEQYLESRFFRVRALAQALRERAAQQPDQVVDIRRAATDLAEERRAFETKARAVLREEQGGARAERLQRMRAQALVLVAELQLLPQVDQPSLALELLRDFEQQYAREPALLGRVLRVRLLAFEQSNQLDEATRALPEYIALDPEGAGATLQELYLTLAEEARRLRRAGQQEEAQRKAQAALLVARQFESWSAAHAPEAIEAQRRAWALQLAEACLAAGVWEEARTRFAWFLQDEAGQVVEPEAAEAEVPVLAGYAEACYQLGDYERALLWFNHLAVGLPAEAPQRWQALLRDLQCRTALEHPPVGILRVIDQQEHLHPDLGGPRYAEEFKKLRRENRRRLDG